MSADDLDPSQFVERIRQLGEQRDQQDAERVRKLEEEIIQGRSERLARRAERARSLSPEKSNTPQSQRSAAGTPRSIHDQAVESPTPVMDPAKSVAREDSLQRLTGSPNEAFDVEPKKPQPPSTGLSRSGTLSWQQRRPQSGTRRPLSMASPERSATHSPRDTPEPSSPAEPSISRTQIAHSLGSKDPSWFKQTPDRGVGSAAYRRNLDDNASDAGSVSGKRQLPGMSRESTAEPEMSSPPPDSIRSNSPSRTDSIRGSAAWSNRFSTNTSVSGGDAEPIGKRGSPMPMLESQRFNPPSDRASFTDGEDRGSIGRSMAMSPSQGRISPERMDRPASPTKGMGGFVQSAMLKRSDSQNKRWSAQTPQGISRQNSTASNSSGYAGSNVGSLAASKSLSKLDARPSTLSRETSLEPSSRPGSSSSNLTITKDIAEKVTTPQNEFVKPALPQHSRGKSITAASTAVFGEEGKSTDESPPSPSKRWSPTKSSWLESALNKPESPKPKLPPPQQPTWMAEISRMKQQRASVDLGSGISLSSPPSGSPQQSPALKSSSSIKAGLEETEAIKENNQQPNETEENQAPPKAKPSVISPKPSSVVKHSDDSSDKPLVLEKTKASNANESSPRPLPTASRFSKESSASPLNKPKPDTPPKKDFRSALKPRQGPTDGPKKEELEFQNVFGKLKRTTTQNYVAPDELKNNILRGKSELTITGGPKPRERKDELKESLIKQKEAMKAKAQEAGSAEARKSHNPPRPTSTPEAIAQRKNLSRTESITSPPSTSREREGTPEALSRKKSLRESAKTSVVEKRTQSAPASTPKEAPKSSKLAERFNPALAGILARGPSPLSNNAGSSRGQPTDTSTSAESTGPGPELTHMTKGRARGPKRRAPIKQETSTAEAKTAPVAPVSLVKRNDILTSNAPAEEPSQKAEDIQEAPASRTPARDSFKAKPLTPAKSPDVSKKFEKPPSPELPRKPQSIELDRKISATMPDPELSAATEVPVEASSKPLTSTPKVAGWKVGARALPTLPTKPVEKQIDDKPMLKNTSPAKSEVSRENDTPESSEIPSFSVKNATALWGRQSISSPPAPTRARSPVKLPTQADEQASMENAGLIRSPEPSESVEPKPLAPKPKPLGLGLDGLGGAIAARTGRESSPPKPVSARYPASPPLSGGGRPQSEPFGKSPAPEKSDNMFAEFFDEPPVTTGELPANIDTLQILTSSPIDLGPASKIRTLRKQIQEISGDGKLSPVPMQEEHVLFEDSMYLCTHVFGNSKGAKTTEVYLWAGNGVAESNVEDAQLFGRNLAKQNQGKLIILRQGRETPNFFEALGGIVITRRGARPASNQYMLCGRRHMGHIAFDEVDLSLKSLCSGFPYIVASSSGTIYLWKGNGCSAEELSGARLIGMDLTSTGTLAELDEGSESPDFFSNFDESSPKGKASATASIPRSADHWRYKASSDKYRARLFRFEQEKAGQGGWGQGLQVSSFFAPLLRRPSWGNIYPSSGEKSPTSRPQTPQTPKSPLPPTTVKVTEIMPFCQRDLEAEYVYLLDAFFEIYIIVSPLSRSQSQAFSTALLFAQEYGILSVSSDDRPFVPVTTVVLEGVPKDMKAVFRHWDERIVPAAGLMRGKLGRGKSLRIVGLESAIKATRQ